MICRGNDHSPKLTINGGIMATVPCATVQWRHRVDFLRINIHASGYSTDILFVLFPRWKAIPIMSEMSFGYDHTVVLVVSLTSMVNGMQTKNNNADILGSSREFCLEIELSGSNQRDAYLVHIFSDSGGIQTHRLRRCREMHIFIRSLLTSRVIIKNSENSADNIPRNFLMLMG